MQVAMALETAVDCNKACEDMSLGSVIYLYLGKHEFFWHFTVKKTSLPLHAERLPFLYIQWFAHVDAICKVGLRGKMCL